MYDKIHYNKKIKNKNSIVEYNPYLLYKLLYFSENKSSVWLDEHRKWWKRGG